MKITRRETILGAVSGAIAAALDACLPHVALGRAARSAGSRTRSQHSIAHAFTAPPKSSRPWVRWWWPGGAVQDREIAREVSILDHSGFAGGEIQPFDAGIFNDGIPAESSPLWQAVNNYATPDFFARVRTAVQAAAAAGTQIDYTFGSGWPSGGGFAITPELALLELTVARTSVIGGTGGPVKVLIPPRTTKVQGALPPDDPRSHDPRVADWAARLAARQRIVAVVAVQGGAPRMTPEWTLGGFKLWGFGAVVKQPGQLTEGSQLVLTDRLKPDGTLDWDPPPGRWEILVFKQYAVNSCILTGVGHGPQLVLDHFKRSAFEAHARRVADPMISALGSDRRGLRATFVDSLELMPDLYWSEDFLQQFKSRRGYDLVPYLPLILQPGWMASWDDHYSPPCYEMSDIGPRVRSDYHQTVSDLYLEGFVLPWIDWNRRNGTLARYQAHGSPSDILKAYGLADIPETEDLWDSADPTFMRFARSAAHLYGRRLVSCESMCWMGRPYSITPLDMRRRADLIFASGVTELVLHGFPFRFQEQHWPGWYPFTPVTLPGGSKVPGFSSMVMQNNPVWVAMPELAGYLARTQAVLRQGEPAVPVAVFYDKIGYFKGITDHGEGKNLLNRTLMAAGYDYDWINPDGLEKAHIEKRRLITAGGVAYRALVIPPIEHVDVEAIERIARLARAGFPLVFVGTTPTLQNAFLNRRAGDQRVKAAAAASIAAGARISSLEKVPATLRKLRVPPNLHFTSESRDIVFVERRVGGQRLYFIHNSGNGDKDATFETSCRGTVQRFDALEGTTATLHTTDCATGTRVHLQLQAGESALLLIDPDRSAGDVQPKTHRVLAQLALPTTGWTLHASGHERGGTAIDRTFRDVTLADWRTIDALKHFSGQGVYSRNLHFDAAWLSDNARILLDLTKVHDVAVVSVNGHRFRPLWGPFSLDVTEALRPGDNSLSIQVCNTPNNALANDDAQPARNQPLQPAGLVGPARLIRTVGRA